MGNNNKGEGNREFCKYHHQRRCFFIVHHMDVLVYQTTHTHTRTHRNRQIKMYYYCSNKLCYYDRMYLYDSSMCVWFKINFKSSSSSSFHLISLSLSLYPTTIYILIDCVHTLLYLLDTVWKIVKNVFFKFSLLFIHMEQYWCFWIRHHFCVSISSLLLKTLEMNWNEIYFHHHFTIIFCLEFSDDDDDGSWPSSLLNETR